MSTSIKEQRENIRAIMQKLTEHRVVRAELQHEEQPHAGIIEALNELAVEFLESGEFLTKILRCPDHQRMLMLECINGEMRYKGMNMRNVLQNTGAEPLVVRTGELFHPDINYETGEELPTGYMEYFETTVEPGGEIELDSDRASVYLYRHCIEAFPPERQQRWPHDKNCLKEVAYSFDMLDRKTGRRRRYDSRDVPEKRKAK